MNKRHAVAIFAFFLCLFLGGLFFYTTSGFTKISVTNLRQVSFAIAFLGGILSIFSPCTIAVLPAFISYTFKEKKEIAKMTLVFFLGFSSAFVILGLIIAYLGKISFVYFQTDSGQIIQLIGFLLVFFGVLTFFGKGFTFINIGYKPGHDILGVFIFGSLFAIGWSACTGPVVSGILSLAVGLNDYAGAALLLFFYSLGIAVPLFLMAFLYDSYNLAEHPILKGKQWSFQLFGNDFVIHTTKAISGLLLAAIGLLFILFKGTTVLTVADLFGRFVVFSLLVLAAYLVYKLVVSRLILSQNLRHLTFLFLFIGCVATFLFLDKKFHISTVGVSEDIDRLILQNPLVFNFVGVFLLVSFLLLAYFVIFRARK